VGDVLLVEATNKGYMLKQIPLVNGGIIAMDPHTGKVLGMIGGYVDSEITLNRVTQAKRQPGSAMKPFVYLTALENGYSPADTIMDEEIALTQGENLPVYRPKNFDEKFHGLITLRKALQNSYNVSTVRLANQIGLKKIAATVKKFGIDANPRHIYSMVLGSVETYLANLTRAYAMIMNGGKYVNIAFLEMIQNKNGQIIFRRDNRHCDKCAVTEEDLDKVEVPFLEDNRPSITDPASAYQITSLLEGAVKYGTAWRAREIGKIIGGKTGTSNEYKDAWFLGGTPDLVLGIYVGFDDNRSLGYGETGSRAAAPIFVEAMTEILKDIPSIPFRIPANIVFKKIDADTGREPILNSPPSGIIMEVFKADAASFKRAAPIIPKDWEGLGIETSTTNSMENDENLMNVNF
jgi:penicillin-binding protein 1A